VSRVFESIEANFLALAESLAAQITLLEGDPRLAGQIDRLRAAHEKAMRGAVLVKQRCEARAGYRDTSLP
jgi:hypothetical protein